MFARASFSAVRLAGSLVLAGIAASPASVQACAACFGKSDDLMAQGMNMGIFALLIVIVSVLAGIAGVGVFFARRAARLAAATAPTAAAPAPESAVTVTSESKL